MRKIRGFPNGLRSGAWSENKFTNLTPYSPYSTEIHNIAKENDKIIFSEEQDEIFIRTYKPSNGFIHPLKQDDIKQAINSIPLQYLSDLRGIFLCSGSKKQKYSGEIRFGTYHNYYKSIFLFPFPEAKYIEYNTKPKPSTCIEYERHGAIWMKENLKWKIQFDARSLHSFYLNDVLYHEIGHHVQNITQDRKFKTYDENERFAEWFALEFGIKRNER